ncbi:MAG TPA: hypothetical protein ENN61_02190, partial [Bacteroidaceae bacterium]|nr:hypothetical protein [Bacteroidaceae bacterium]
MKNPEYKKALLVLVSITLCCVDISIAQISGRAYEIPQKYLRPVVNTSFIDAYKPAHSRTWIVYSDQRNNIAYKRPYGNLIKGVMPMMEQFYVIEREGDYLRIIKDPELTPEGFFSSQAKDYGWV